MTRLTLGLCLLTLLTLVVGQSSSRSKRCYVCRSRGVLGDCRDPFYYNSTQAGWPSKAVEPTPCPSGWCGKVIEGKPEDHVQATERLCLQRPPADDHERCQETIYDKYQKAVFMCFCKGDLCNGSLRLSHISALTMMVSSIICFILS
ncbi:hypothetical protein HDE_01487 [Halotydeus destructor]|nr:hypothetical protein HDE_01487 [Halotydeus destructor]